MVYTLRTAGTGAAGPKWAMERRARDGAGQVKVGSLLMVSFALGRTLAFTEWDGSHRRTFCRGVTWSDLDKRIILDAALRKEDWGAQGKQGNHAENYFSNSGKKWWWLGPDGNTPGGKKLWNPKYNLKIEPAGFPDGLDVQQERKERSQGQLQGF